MEHVLSWGDWEAGRRHPGPGWALGWFNPRRAYEKPTRVDLDIDDEEVNRRVKSFVTMITIN